MDTNRPLLPVIAIDDDPDDLFFIKRRISRGGVTNPIVTFTSGGAAIEALEAMLRNGTNGDSVVAAVFCDIKMPEMNGFQVLRWFRANERFSRTPFYILSGSNEPVDRDTAVELGANGYLVKFPPESAFAEIIGAAASAPGVVRCP